jgi:two-component system, cell cycle response regulator
MTLRRRLTLVLALLVAVPVTAAALIVGIAVPGTLRTQSEESLAVTRGGVAAAIAARCDRSLLAARSLGLYLAAADPVQAVRDTTLTTGVDFAALVDRAGRLVAADGAVSGDAATTQANCGDGRAAGPALVARVPLEVADKPDLRSAVTAQTVDRGTLMAIQSELGTTAHLTLLLGGRPVATTMPAGEAEAVAEAVADAGADADVGEARGALEVGPWLAMAAKPGMGQPFTVVVAEQPASSGSVRWAVLITAALAIAAAVVVARALARGLTRPLDQLTQAASGVASGDLGTKLPARGEDEVGRLSAAFNNMTAALRLSMTALERSRDEMRLSLQRLGDALSSTHDLEGICHITVETALSATVADAGLVALVNSQGELEPVAAVGLADHGLRTPGTLRAGHGLLGSVVADGRIVRARLDRDILPDPEEPGQGHVLAVPLRRKSGIGGVLAVYVLAGSGFDDGDEATLRTLAHQAGIAIDNAILHLDTERLSVTDALTGVANYHHVMAGLSREVERASRFSHPLSVLMLDLDHFKQVNDAHGQERANAVLRELAQRIKGKIREIDTVARYAGEEFVLLLPETGADGAARVAERVCDVVRAESFRGGRAVAGPGAVVRPPTVGDAGGVEDDLDGPAGASDGAAAEVGEKIQLTVSIGGAVFPEHGGSAEALIASADSALYLAKRAGRNRWAIAGQTGQSGADMSAPEVSPN